MGLARVPLLWKVFAINAALLVAAALLLVAARDRVHTSLGLVEGLDVAVWLVVMLAANLVLVHHTVRPIQRLAERMQAVDLLQPGQRLAEGGGPEVAQLVRGFNQMLERLEEERRESARRALRAQEDERLRVAQGLHDEVGQVLTGVLLQLDALRGSADADRELAVDETKQAVRQALEDVRRIAQELRPEMLEHLGLVSALTELARRFSSSSGIKVVRQLHESLPPLSEEAELAVYRVAQESLTNVARHAGATCVTLTLERGADSVILHVTDDGRGLPGRVDGYAHGGLRGMRERALLVGGVLAVKPAPDSGVEVRLEVPARAA
ncbi:MAG: HAMP domain-containing sensor histidine kinase [Gaiellales bacterium]